jgi:hypothetical protein
MKGSFIAIVAACLLVLPASAADGPVIVAVTGPGDAITFTLEGQPVAHLEPGTYTIEVDDTSARRDFTLRGPGVSEHSGFEPVGKHTWSVTFTDGWYRYYDAAFEPDFHGEFSVGNPPPVTLQARVDDTSISFTRDGAPVRQLDPGSYSIGVADLSERQNFRLIGPGAEEHTQHVRTASYTWTVVLTEGTYSYFSERRPQMRGSFTIGSPVRSTAKILHAVVGPDFNIALVDQNWQPLTAALKNGKYAIDVLDPSGDHNFRLTGPGVNRSTTLAFAGRTTLTATLGRGFYRFFCDPHSLMAGDFTVTAPKAKPKKKPKKKKPRR